MSLLAHHIKKDARHLRWLLGLWVLLVAAEALLIGFGNRAGQGDFVAQAAYEMVAMFLPVLQYVLVLVMVPLLLQDEPLVGHTAFWYTRPIPRSLLLSSKLLFCFVAFVLFPALVEVGVLAASRVPLNEIIAVVPEQLFYGLVGLMPILALAVLTPNFARYAILGVGLLIAFTVVSVVLSIAELYIRGIEEVAEREGTLLLSRSIVSSAVLLAAGTAVVLCQYLVRRTAFSIALVVAGLAAGFAVNKWWPVDFMQLPGIEAKADAFDCASLSIEVDDGYKYVRSSSGRRAAKEPEQQVNTTLVIKGIPPAHNARIIGVRSMLAIDGQDAIAYTNRSTSRFSSRRWTKSKIEEVFPDAVVFGDNSSYSDSQRIASVPMQRYMEVRNMPGTLEGEAEVVVERLREGHAFPLTRGSLFRDGSRTEIISDARATPSGALISLRVTKLKRIFVRHRAGWNAMEDSGSSSSVQYVLRHRKSGVILMPEKDSGFDPADFTAARRLSARTLYLRYAPASENSQPGFPEIDEEWLAGAELVRVSLDRIAECTVAFRAENFTLAEKKRTYKEHSHKGHTHKHESSEDAESPDVESSD